MSRDVVPVDAAEVDTIASELAAAYRRMAAFYRDDLELTGADADARARGADATPEEAAADLARITDAPPDQVSWFELTRLTERSPEELSRAWQRIKTAARDELASGHRTAAALEWQGNPWDRARFLAIRDSFRGDGPPHTGIEAALIDSAAEAFNAYLEQTEHLTRMVSVDMKHEEDRSSRYGEWQPQRLSYAEAIDRAARMAEQAHARFLRTVKTLHEVRRMAAHIYVGHAGQVNLGHQQVNIAPPLEDDSEG